MANPQDENAFVIDRGIGDGRIGDGRICAVEYQMDRAWVCTRRHYEIILQSAVIAVIDEINTGINRSVADFGIRRDIRAPPGRIFSDEIINFAGEFVGPAD